MDSRHDAYLPGAGLIIFLMASVLLIPWLGETLFNSKGEPREAIVAVSMIQQGDWILPHNFGTDIPYKPPFMAWIIAVLAIIFNGGEVNEFLSRLPSALAALAMIMGSFYWARSVRGTRFGMIFSLVLLTCIEVFRASVACRLDMILMACMTGAVYMLYNLMEHDEKWRPLRYAAVIILLSCATLTKGPVGSLLPCLAMGLYGLLRGRRFFPTFFRMLGIAVASMVIPALWYYAAYLRGGDGFFDLMMEENIGRLTGNMSYESHVNPFWYNFVTIILGLLPWTVLLIAALPSARRLKDIRLTPAGKLALTVAATVIIFYCIPSSKRSVYLLPAYPFLCYGITALLCDDSSAKTTRFFTWMMATIAILAPALAVAMQFYPMKFLPMDTLEWWQYIMLAFPVIFGLAWFINRHSPVGHLLLIIWGLYLAYASAIMPAVLNPKSDTNVVPELMKAPAVLCTEKFRPYTANFYLDNKVKPIKSFGELTEYPKGTIILTDVRPETLDIPNGFDTKLLKQRSCDHRTPMYAIIKK